jgi:hypothetical protein
MTSTNKKRKPAILIGTEYNDTSQQQKKIKNNPTTSIIDINFQYPDQHVLIPYGDLLFSKQIGQGSFGQVW